MWNTCSSEVSEVKRLIFESLIICLSIFSCWVFHSFHFFNVFDNFILNYLLVLTLSIPNNLLTNRFTVMCSELVLCLRNEIYSKLIDFSLIGEGMFIRSEVVLNWWIVFSPSHDFTHAWIKVSQVLLFTIQLVLSIVAQMCGLVLHFSSDDVRSADIPWVSILEAFSSEYFLNLSRFITSSLQRFSHLLVAHFIFIYEKYLWRNSGFVSIK